MQVRKWTLECVGKLRRTEHADPNRTGVSDPRDRTHDLGRQSRPSPLMIGIDNSKVDARAVGHAG